MTEIERLKAACDEARDAAYAARDAARDAYAAYYNARDAYDAAARAAQEKEQDA
jgi:hypothetical protein